MEWKWNSKVMNPILIAIFVVFGYFAVTVDFSQWLVPKPAAPKAAALDMKPTAKSSLVATHPPSKLHLAVQHGNLVEVKALLEQGADVNAKDEQGLTPLHHTAGSSYRGGDYRDIAELLIVKGADVNAGEHNGPTPLHLAATENAKDVAELLIANGANVNATDDGLTPLHFVAGTRKTEVAELLITNGANVNAKKDNGTVTPLDMAVINKDIIVAEFLIAKGAKVKGNVGDGLTPLHAAVMQKDKAMVELLLSKGADVNDMGSGGLRPLDLAQGELADFLKSKGAKSGEDLK